MSRYLQTCAAFLLIAISANGFALELESEQQKFSYVLGVQFGQQLKSEGIAVDGTAFAAAINDVLWGKPLQMTMPEMQAALQAGRQKLMMEKQAKAQAKLAAGKAFLEQNKTREGVVVLPSGLQYIELKAGSGDSPAPGSKVTVNYRGTLIDGTEFDSSYKRGEPTSFSLDGVIPGFKESISLMKPGAKWQVFIPSNLGYGPNGAGNSIGPNETLIFEIELLSVASE
ncbi:MAG: FKBP-type peptidyl-prolyl cis-trans isomerase [Gammaproteobacteria bacterium]|nr:FKBP-type peptidyl-prolyl cis-trans isomerase [Gammaproteobacteria bacterium]